ncbi:MAG TPA: efflux RND transporter periplasmic adaptor subunit [Candidatus Binataceae bacterium]|nr:efflux RND transporter periplasmic adaptor subunit [Candidatus Binataceae bacterium]
MKLNLTAAILAVAIALTACHTPAVDPPKLGPPQVSVIRPQAGGVERTITLPGDLAGYYEAALYSKVTGYLKSISVDKGDSVHSGQLLAVVEVPELGQQLARAQANLEIQKLTYERLQRVWQSDPRLVARQDVDIAYSKFQEAKANADQLRAMESYTRIIAPFDGVITERFVDPGALIHAGGQQSTTAPTQGAELAGGSAAPIVSIARLDKLRIYVYVPQAEVDYIRDGMPATVTVQGFDGAQFSGTVTRFAHSLDLSTRTMLTEVDLENPERRLYPGMYANVTLVLERDQQALRLPDSAIGGDSAHTVLVVRSGRLKEVPVTTGINNGQYVEITSGLSRKDLVVQTFSPALHAGEAVNANAVTNISRALASVE